jgi:ABC-type Zn uptake system ZnuABC Zn-binding protein ZnuA
MNKRLKDALIDIELPDSFEGKTNQEIIAEVNRIQKESDHNLATLKQYDHELFSLLDRFCYICGAKDNLNQITTQNFFALACQNHKPKTQ